MRFAHVLMKWSQLFFIGFLLYSYAMFQGAEVSWFLFYLVLPFLLYLFVFTLYPAHKAKASVYVKPQLLEAGHSIEVEVSFKRKWPMPFVYLSYRPVFSSTLDTTFNNPRDFLSASFKKRLPILRNQAFFFFQRKASTRLIVDELPRGHHHIIGVEVRMRDVFLFHHKAMILPVDQSFIVKPYKLNIQKQVAPLFLGQAHSQKRIFKENIDQISGVRPYESGDKLSRINWKKTAQTDMLMTKVFDEVTQKEADLLVLLNGNHQINEWQLVFVDYLIRQMKKKRGRLNITIDDGVLIDIPSQTKTEDRLLLLSNISGTEDNQTLLPPFVAGQAIMTASLDKAFDRRLKEAHEKGQVMDVYLMCDASTLPSFDRQVYEQLKSEGHLFELSPQKMLIKDGNNK